MWVVLTPIPTKREGDAHGSLFVPSSWNLSNWEIKRKERLKKSLQKLLRDNYEQKLLQKIMSLYINHAENMRFLGILAYQKTCKFKIKREVRYIYDFNISYNLLYHNAGHNFYALHIIYQIPGVLLGSNYETLKSDAQLLKIKCFLITHVPNWKRRLFRVNFTLKINQHFTTNKFWM